MSNETGPSAGRAIVDYLKKVFVVRKDYKEGDTYRSCWQKTDEIKRWYIIYRAAHAFFTAASVIISVLRLFLECPYTEEARKHSICFGKYAQLNAAWPFYFTSWGLVMNVIQGVLGLVLIMRAYKLQSTNALVVARSSSQISSVVVQREHKISSITGFYWGMRTAALVFAWPITATYWPLIYKPQHRHGWHLLSTVVEHACNLVILLVDYAITAFPIVLQHVYFVLAVILSYGVSNFTYCKAGGMNFAYTHNYLYSFAKWDTIGSSLRVVLGEAIGSLLIFFMMMVVDHYKFYLLSIQNMRQNFQTDSIHL